MGPVPQPAIPVRILSSRQPEDEKRSSRLVSDTFCVILKAKHLVLAFAGVVIDIKVSSSYRFVKAIYIFVFVERLCGINVDQLSKQLSSQYCSSLTIICFFLSIAAVTFLPFLISN